MNRYYISVAGWNGAGVTAPCIIIGREFEAETERTAGEAAEKSKVAADAELYVAEKKAEANRALNDSLNSNLLEYYRITNVDSLWNGELPTYVGGDGSIPIINGIN